ncbi:MAG: PAS domain S-box protein [Vicingaceae bacterium]|nr:PAS domain S-box protein [Vicingaceae bacterium]
MLNNQKLYTSLPEKINQLLSFFDASSDSVMICDINLCVNYVNTSFTKLTGYKIKEVLGKNYQDFNPDSAAKILNKKNWDKILKGKTISISCTSNKKNGSEYFLEKSIIPVHSKKNTGTITHLIFSEKDSTRHDDTINKLIKSERALAEAQKIANLGYYELDIKNDSWTSSTELNNIFGIKGNLHKNFNSWLNLIHPDYKEVMMKYFAEEVLTKKKKFDKEYKIIDFKTGQEKWVHGLGNLKFDEKQQPLEMLGTIQDITEKKEAERALIASENKFRQIFEKSSDSILIIQNGLFIDCNSATVKLLGYDSKSELLNVTPYEISPKFQPDGITSEAKANRMIKLALVNGGHRFEWIHLKKNGEQVPVEVVLTSITNEPINWLLHCTVRDISDRKKAELALIASEDKFRSIFHSLTAGMIIVIDENGLILEWNEGAELNFGYDKHEMFNKPLTMLMPERFIEGHERGFSYAIKNRTLAQKGKTFELFGLHKNGKEFPIELSLGSWERNGKLFFSAIIIDVTERKLAKKHLLQANSILEDIDSIVLLTNINGEVVYTTSAVKKLVGFEPNEILGDKWWELTFTDQQESNRVKNELIGYLKNNEQVRTTYHPRLLQCKDGSLKWFEWHNSKGVDNCIISVGYDITYRVLAEREINKLSIALDQSPVTVIITDLNGDIEYVNPNFEKTTGYSLKEVKGKNPKLLKSGETSVEIYKQLWETISAGGVWKGEFHNIKKDGTLFCERASIGPILNKNGEIINYVALKEDITEKKSIEKQLNFTLSNLESLVKAKTEQLENARNKLEISLSKEKELGELKSKFVSTASHQFRTPLTVIQANIGLINMQVDSIESGLKEKLFKVTNRIQSEVERMTELMNDVLILGKINAGSVKPIFNSTDLLAIVEETAKKYDDIQNDGRKVKIERIGEPRHIMIDGKLMEHTISNLISNAFKYSVNKPSPILTLDYKKNQVQISVRDFGIGIPTAEVKNLFQAFYRASNANDLPGTGLGVAIAKEYTELNGGTISVISKLNEGSEFIAVFKNK